MQTKLDNIGVLLDEIKDECDIANKDTVDVIMLIGLPGAGKSSFINTIHKALTNKYILLAKSVTADVTWYKHCGVDLGAVKNPKRKEKLTKMVKKLPHLVDMSGFGNSDKYKTVLELLLGGYVDPGASSQAIQNMNEQQLRKMYKSQKSEWKVTKVCFVQSVRDLIPQKLIDCLMSTLAITDPANNHRKYKVETFLVMSKWDLVSSSSHQSDEQSDQAEKTRREMLEIFNMEGSSRLYCHTVTSYCDDTGYDDKGIDTNVLKCLKMLARPIPKQPDPPSPPPSFFSKFYPPRNFPPRASPPPASPPRDSPPRASPPRASPPRDSPPRDYPPRDSSSHSPSTVSSSSSLSNDFMRFIVWGFLFLGLAWLVLHLKIL